VSASASLEPARDDAAPSLLMIAPHFVPEPTVAGLRASYWAHYLVERGCQVTVVVPRRVGPLPDLDDEDLPWLADLRILELPMPPPLPFSATTPGRRPGVRRARREVVGVVGTPFVPDRQQGYWESTLPLIRPLAEAMAPTAVLTTSPPHSLHLIGRDLKRQFDIPWIADLRDPYLDDTRFSPKGMVGGLMRGRHEAFERSIYTEADLVVHAIQGHFTRARREFPEQAQHLRYVPNGFPDEMLDLPQSPTRSLNDAVRLVSAGVSGPRELAIVADAIDNFGSREPTVEMRICGPSPSDPANRSRARSQVLYLGHLHHRRALQEIMSADVLLAALSIERSKVGGCSSKLYEYMATGRPIVVINPTREDEHLLATNYDWFTILRQPSSAQVEDALRAAIRRVAQQGDGTEVRPAVERVRRVFRRSNGAEELYEELQDLALPIAQRAR
jgi:glycosyltransferase involved in cell wall biosynthesis